MGAEGGGARVFVREHCCMSVFGGLVAVEVGERGRVSQRGGLEQAVASKATFSTLDRRWRWRSGFERGSYARVLRRRQ